MANFVLNQFRQRVLPSPAKITASSNGSPSASDLLKRFLETTNVHGKTALHHACYSKSCSIIELLVDAGADLNAVDNDGNTAIMLAALSGPGEDQGPLPESSPSIFKVFIN